VIGERSPRLTVTDRPIHLADGTIIRSEVRARYRRISSWIATTDGLSIVVAMLIAYLVRFGVQPVSRDFTILISSAPIACVAIFSGFGLYSVQVISPADEFRRIVAAIGTIVATISLFGFWSRIPYSREWLGLTWVLTLLLCLAVRKRWHQAIARKRVDGTLAYRTLVVGANDEARNALEALRAPALGFRPVGVVTTGSGIGHEIRASGLPLIEIPAGPGGNVEAFRQVIRELGVDCVFVASTAVTPEETAQIAKASRLEGVEARLSLNLPHILPTRLTVQPLDDLTIVSLKSACLSGGQAAAKRAVDIVGATVGLLIMAPILVGIGLAITISSGGPILFRQVRVGKQGRPFTLLKFRTMIPGAEGMLIDLRDRNEADGPLFKIREDPRVTSVGRWLRKWSLDELPQLVNVLKGEMSLVGPRPPLNGEVDAYEDWQYGRLEVAPGITGLWQVGGRIELSFEDAVRRDIFYIENWSLSYDLFILAKTVPAVLSHRGAY
jgi:exopolysaccharide biosynthesis polyprenyl glycosylphosphotransferase